MGDIVELKSKLPDENDTRFVEDLTRYTEKFFTETDIRKRYRLTDADREKLGANDKLSEAIAECRLKRRHNGATKRERAQIHVEGAPDVLNGILQDKTAPVRQRIESAKVLDAMAVDKSTEAASSEKFVIQINLGDETLRYEHDLKPVEPLGPDGFKIEDGDKGNSQLAITKRTKNDDQW